MNTNLKDGINTNASTATKLQTARKINGVSFDGTSDIAINASTSWENVTGKPSTFPATTHTHDDRYYTESESDSRYLGKTSKSVDSDKLDGIDSTGFCRAYSSVQNFGGNQNRITTSQFITMLDGMGAFSTPYWVARGSWSYANNQIIDDTECGFIHLAGCTVEVVGSKSAFTIMIHTPTTSGSGVTHGDFVYVNNGDQYSPGWRRLYNTVNNPSYTDLKDIPSTFTPSSHTHAYLPLGGGVMKNNIKFDTTLTGLKWEMNSDYASIYFKNDADSDVDSYLAFETGDNGNEYFKWLTNQSGTRKDLMSLNINGLNLNNLDLKTSDGMGLVMGTDGGSIYKKIGGGVRITPNSDSLGVVISNKADTADVLTVRDSDIKFKGNLVWHAGNDGSGSGLDADKLDGHDSTYFATSSHNHDSTYVKSSDIPFVSNHENGYQKLPGGIIMQWGWAYTSNGSVTINFPLAFGDNIYGVSASVDDPGLRYCSVSETSNVRMKVLTDWSLNPVVVRWVAMGKL